MARDSDKPLIMIVEPADVIGQTIALILRQQKYRAVWTASMSQALELASQEPPDLVITNLVLRPGEGLELCRQMRNDNRLSAIPVIMLTGQKVDEESLQQAGIDLFLPMPVHPLDLIEKMKPLLENYAAYNAAARTGEIPETE